MAFDITILETALGLASTAVGVTGKAVSTVEAVKKLLSTDNRNPDSAEAMKLVSALAAELTAANLMNVDLSGALKALSAELRNDDQFEKEKARYYLFTTTQGDVVYKLRPDAADGEPDHYICPACLKKDRLIIFIQGSGDYKHCQVDKSHVYTFGRTAYRQASTDYNPFT